MAFPPRTTHGDVNGLQPLHTQLTKPEASLSRKMLCSGSQEFFFLGFTVHGWHSSDQWPSLCQPQKEKKFGQRHDAASEKATQTQSFHSHLSGATFQQEICSTYFTNVSQFFIHVYQFSPVFTNFYRYIQMQWLDDFDISHLMTPLEDKTIKIWSLETFSSTKTLYGHTSTLLRMWLPAIWGS